MGCIINLIKKWFCAGKKTEPVVVNRKEKDEDVLFVQTWGLTNFALRHSNMKVAPFTNKDTGRPYYKCIFTDTNGEQTWVSIMSYLKKPTAQEISNRKEELKIGKMANGKYYLYDKDVKCWEDVEL